MTFLKKNRKRVIFIGLVIFSIGVFVFLQNNPPKEPIILYKATQPSKPQANVDDTASSHAHNHALGQDHNHNHDHDHSHDTAPDFRTVQGPPSDDAYDWRDGNPYDAQRPKTDPWKKSDVQQADTEASTNSSEDSEVYPPPNWHLTKDPALRAEYFHAQLINQFGDIPEVHTGAAYQRKKELGIPVTSDEYIESLEARYHLWPNKSILKALERLRKERKKRKASLPSSFFILYAF